MNKSENRELNLQSLKTIRSQSQRLLTLARQGLSAHFTINDERMPVIVDYVVEVMRSQYPGFEIPYHSRWRHFEAGGIDRIKALFAYDYNQSSKNTIEAGKILYELVIISVLVDAGAGNKWLYREAPSEQVYSRSEGLALASLDLYCSGVFSADPEQPLRVDAQPLLAFTQAKLRQGFQVTDINPLEGVAGRVDLLNRLGKVIQKQTNYFAEEGRLGNFYSYILSLQNNKSIALPDIFQVVELAFREIWPERLRYKDIPLGDVWAHSALKSEDNPGLIPFHKLSQWLTYSLIEPLEAAGIKVTDLDELTGLPEYRNGGLLVDLGLLAVKNPQMLSEPQAPDSDQIVEWRALTVALLDELADAIRQKLKMNATTLPLAKILQGGTWEAGRRIAKQKRPDGRPPIQIISDGTIF
ncbi:MAG: URC4/urg3 family protein [Tatlockia sp.]|nr:URC4/urg3 family protein [Tatlockia sp.]